MSKTRDGEIIPPNRAARAAGRALRSTMRAAFERTSMARYLAVFGAVPDSPMALHRP